MEIKSDPKKDDGCLACWRKATIYGTFSEPMWCAEHIPNFVKCIAERLGVSPESGQLNEFWDPNKNY